MEIVNFIQKFFVFLLPGIIGLYLYSSLNIQKEEHYYFVILKMIVLSFFSYSLTNGLFLIISTLFPCFIWKPVDIINHISNENAAIPTQNAVVSIGFSLLLSCLLTKAVYLNWAFLLANRLKLTRRIDNQTVWEHVFDDCDVVVLRDKVTNNTYYGRVKSFSDNSTNRELYLEDVRVFDVESNFLYYAKNVYLSRAHNEFIIEKYDYTAQTEGEKNDVE